MFKPQMVILITVLACSSLLAAPPVRKFDDPGSPPFKVLKEGENPPLDADDNFVIGPKYVPAPERKTVEGVPEGKVEQFVIDSKETKLFNPGIARKEFGKVDPKNPKTLIVETHTIDYKRKITVYIPAQYKAGQRSAVHGHPRRSRREAQRRVAAHPRQPDRPEADSADHRHLDRQRRRRRPGARARQRIRQDVRRLCRVHRNRGAAARGEELRGEADQRPRRPRGDGQQFRRLGRAHHGLVSHRSLPPRADHVGHVREPAVAVRSQVSRRGLGLSRNAHSQQPQEAHPACSSPSATRTCSTPT